MPVEYGHANKAIINNILKKGGGNTIFHFDIFE